MADKKKHSLFDDIFLLFDRPNEPVFTPKGEDGVLIDIPKGSGFLDEDDNPVYEAIVSNFTNSVAGSQASSTLEVANVKLPDISFPGLLGRMDQFSLFVPLHKKMASSLIEVFMKARDEKELMSWATYARSHINPVLFNYALSVAMLHRTDTKSLSLPSFAEMFPDKYVDSQTLTKARAEVTVAPKGTEVPIRIPRNNTAADNNIEHRIAYFREDIGVNLHHWHWHLVYPNSVPDKFIVGKDRRGELFYYMHHQVLGRYNFERLSNNMNRVKRLNNLREPIEEGYFPKLDSYVAGRGWPSRQDNTMPRDVVRELDGINLDISELERWRDRILEAIADGFVTRPDGTRVPLNETDGTDIIGNLVEASTLSVNRQYYGDLHNMGHVILAYIHDPQHLHSESFGVMGDFATAMRDPVFYRWHAYLDDIFRRFKGTLPRYTKESLNFPGISVKDIEIEGIENEITKGRKDPNDKGFHSFFQESDVNLSRGMDFAPRRPVFARFTHLQHENFNYKIKVNNTSDKQKMGTCRIFIGPKHNEKGEPFLMRDLHLLMVELDKFVVTLKPGENIIVRSALDSSVTIPFNRTYRNLDEGRGAEGSDNEAQFNFCGCGWPQNLLIPKGKAHGMEVYLFAMISDRYIDRIDQDEEGECHDAASYCGLRDRRYPDSRNMGYPFDRNPEDTVSFIEDFITPNMKVIETTIKHHPAVLEVKNSKAK